MRDILRKSLVRASGPTGTVVISTGSLLGSLLLTGQWVPSGWMVLMALVIIRISYSLSRGAEPVLGGSMIGKRAWQVLEDEAKVVVAVLAVCFIAGWPLSRMAVGLYFAASFALQVITLHAVRMTLRISADRDTGLSGLPAEKQVYIVGTGMRAKFVADRILDTPQLHTCLRGFLDYREADLWRYRDIPLAGHPDALSRLIANRQVDALLIATEPEDLPRTNRLFEEAERMGITVCLMPDIYRTRIATARAMNIVGLPAMVYRAVPENRCLMTIKRVVDRMGAAVGVLLSLPVMLLAVAAIKLDSPGPVFFKQKRSGLNGRAFEIYKFRTMHTGAEAKKRQLKTLNEMSGPVFKIKNDPRITRVGKYLRKFSVDELPQLINVLKGEMSLVGPRPPLPEEVAEFEPWQRRKLSVKPGITCLWQVNGRNQTDFEDWMRLDLQYIDKWSPWLDAKILAKTIPAVARGTGV